MRTLLHNVVLVLLDWYENIPVAVMLLLLLMMMIQMQFCLLFVEISHR